MSNTPIAMSVDEWSDLYLPIVNHLDANASFDDGNGGIMFETYGEEVEYVFAQPSAVVWTYVDGDDGTYILAGRHYVNRIGYFITEYPWITGFNDKNQIQVSSNAEMEASK